MSGLRGEIGGSRFDVNEYVSDGWETGADGVLYGVRDGVPFFDGEVGVNDHMKIGVEMEAHLPDAARFDGDDLVDSGGGVTDGGVDCWIRRGVHDVGDRVSEQIDAIVDDEDTGEEGGVIIGGFESWAAEDGDGDPDECGEGGEGVGAMMPRVGMDGGASDLEGEFEDPSEEDLFDEDDADEDGEGEWRGGVVRGDDLADAACCEDEGGDDEGECNGEGGEGFGFPVSVRVFVIWRFRGEREAEPDHG